MSPAKRPRTTGSCIVMLPPTRAAVSLCFQLCGPLPPKHRLGSGADICHPSSFPSFAHIRWLPIVEVSSRGKRALFCRRHVSVKSTAPSSANQDPSNISVVSGATTPTAPPSVPADRGSPVLQRRYHSSKPNGRARFPSGDTDRQDEMPLSQNRKATIRVIPVEGTDAPAYVPPPTINNYNNNSSNGTTKKHSSANAAKPTKKRSLSEDTKRKIAYSMLGQTRSLEMRAKVSEKLKGRVPWNKGKKLSPETRARMSEARFGRRAWNKGRRLTQDHRRAIAIGALAAYEGPSSDTIARKRMARRRPGDGIVSGGASADIRKGFFPIVETVDIHEYVTLRRELRLWSDRWYDVNGKRPTMADVRRTARPRTVRKFEKYVIMRGRIRGLAADVYGGVDPDTVPSVNPKDLAYGPRNNNSGLYMGDKATGSAGISTKSAISRAVQAGASCDVLQDDGQDQQQEREDSGPDIEAPLVTQSFLQQNNVTDSPENVDVSSAPAEEELKDESDTNYCGKNGESFKPVASEYRAIGKYRLMESIEINEYVQTRRELSRWSEKFKEEHGHVPALSDVRAMGDPNLYRKFCDYIENRDRISGLVQEVCGTEIDNVEEIQRLADTGRNLVDQLNLKVPQILQARRLRNRSPPSILNSNSIGGTDGIPK